MILIHQQFLPHLDLKEHHFTKKVYAKMILKNFIIPTAFGDQIKKAAKRCLIVTFSCSLNHCVKNHCYQTKYDATLMSSMQTRKAHSAHIVTNGAATESSIHTALMIGKVENVVVKTFVAIGHIEAIMAVTIMIDVNAVVTDHIEVGVPIDMVHLVINLLGHLSNNLKSIQMHGSVPRIQSPRKNWCCVLSMVFSTNSHWKNLTLSMKRFWRLTFQLNLPCVA
mmetsp:Transcript_20720/g.30806  ORF Transcript_20720/g.30806 Transcript_20720/m.30806 type:complete len:223 (-) Transcript_20720:2299-2967(-)